MKKTQQPRKVIKADPRLEPDAIILNQDLEDLPCEEWRDLPGLDGVALISNLGRVKRLSYQSGTSDGRLVTYKERIQKIKIWTYTNLFLNEPVYYATARVQFEGKPYLIAIGRLSYYCFVEKFNLDDKSVMVVHKDHNSLNNRPDNLMLSNYSNFHKHVSEAGRKDQHFGHSQENALIFTAMSRKLNMKAVSKYSLDGELLETFNSLTEAASASGITITAISNVTTKKALTANGFIYCFGQKKKISTADTKKRRAKQQGLPVSMYNLDGQWLKTFENSIVAQKEMGCSVNAISSVIRGKNLTAGGYIWRRGTAKKINTKAIRASVDKWNGCILSQYDLKGRNVVSFPSAKAASKHIGVDQNTITAHASRFDLILKGHIWRMGDAPSIHKASFKDAKEYTGTDRPKEVTQYDLDGKRIQSYANPTEASKITGLALSVVTSAANGLKLTGGGYYWRRGNGPKKITTVPQHMNPANYQPKAVCQCKLSGKKIATYPSILAASKATGINNNSIGSVLRKGTGIAAGFLWKYI